MRIYLYDSVSSENQALAPPSFAKFASQILASDGRPIKFLASNTFFIFIPKQLVELMTNIRCNGVTNPIFQSHEMFH